MINNDFVYKHTVWRPGETLYDAIQRCVKEVQQQLPQDARIQKCSVSIPEGAGFGFQTVLRTTAGLARLCRHSLDRCRISVTIRFHSPVAERDPLMDAINDLFGMRNIKDKR